MTPRAALLAAALALPAAAQGQSLAEMAGGPGPADQPRALAVFEGVEGYADLAAERVGTVAQPAANELGLLLVTRMFRNLCLGLEQGAPLDTLLPEPLAAYGQSSYLFGLEAGDAVAQVVSPTGSIEQDEAEGRPSLWLAPSAMGMTCRIEWAVAEFPADVQQAMARYLDDWLPFELALVRASRPVMTAEQPLSNFTEWDRPCGDRWCATTVAYRLAEGFVSIETTLDITDIEGDRP